MLGSWSRQFPRSLNNLLLPNNRLSNNVATALKLINANVPTALVATSSTTAERSRSAATSLTWRLNKCTFITSRLTARNLWFELTIYLSRSDAIFHPDSLCMDTYIRSYMDEEGYVPIALVCTYQNVAYFGSSYEDIFHKLIQVEPKAQFYELDQQNETIRPKAGWEKFRMPNVFGGFGLPKYVKQPFGSEGYYGGEVAADATAASAEVTTGADNSQN